MAEQEAERAQLQARLQQLAAQREARESAIFLEMVQGMPTKMHDTLTDGDIQAERALLSKVIARIDMGREGARLSYTFPLGK